MGQYFLLVNLDKREYVDAIEIGGLAKLWEWCRYHPRGESVKRWSGVIYFLLRKSSEVGGGDIQKPYEMAGRWAGDRIVLVGDYDKSKLFQTAKLQYGNISSSVMEEYKDFMRS